MRTKLALLAVMVPGVALADDGLRGRDGFYARTDGSFAMESDQDVSVTGSVLFNDPGTPDVIADGTEEVDLPDGYGFTIGAGWASQDTGLRIEALFIHERREDTNFGWETKLRSSGVYLAALYDFDRLSRTQPFVGVGVGVNNVELNDDLLGKQDQSEFSYLFTGGLAFVLNDHLVADVAYRYQATPDLEYNWSEVDPDPVNGFAADLRVEGDLVQHSVNFGLRYMFH